MKYEDELIIGKLKELIDKEGPGYLTENSYSVYKELTDIDYNNTIIASAILMLLVSGKWDSVKHKDDCDELSQSIRLDCCFNKRMSDRLANIIHMLYSQSNRSEWDAKKQQGLEQFMTQVHAFRWEGYAAWEISDGHVDCYYDADIKLKPLDEARKNKDLVKMLKKNPFLSADEIYKFYDKELDRYLNKEFEEYCTCDDYYEPCADDFEIGYYVDDWCKKYGFVKISCEGEGNEGEFVSRFRDRYR